MYRIAIGDDDPIFLNQAAHIASETMSGEGLLQGSDYDVDCYPAAPPLLSALCADKDRYQLLLLDVEFGGDNGLAVAASLRERRGTFSLIYVTSHREYVFESFDTHPLHYLLKPVDPQKLSGLILEDYRRRYAGARLYLKAGGRHISVPHRSIYAVEAAHHKVLFHFSSCTREWNGSLHTLAPELPSWCFCRCHNSYFVNLTHVSELVRYEARLENGAVIPVSKRFYKSAIGRYIAFLKN